MKSKILSLLFIAFLATATTSCSGDDEGTPATNPTTAGEFTATIGSENVSTDDTFLAAVSAGGTQAFIATLSDGRTFSSAIFPSQFPINEAVNIGFSSSITYKVGDVIYIPSSGTMTFSIIEPYQRLKGTFNGVFVNGTEELTISGTFDISN